jgi:hypothetical protein
MPLVWTQAAVISLVWWWIRRSAQFFLERAGFDGVFHHRRAERASDGQRFWIRHGYLIEAHVIDARRVLLFLLPKA